MSGTPEISTPSTDAPNAPEEKPVTPRVRKPAVTQAELDAMIAGAVAKSLAEVVPGIVAAVVARLTPPVAPVAPVPPVAPVAPVPDAAPAATVTKPVATTTASENKTWKCQAYVGKLQDRLTKNGVPELVVWVKPASAWYYPVAYKGVRDAVLAAGVRVGDKIALDGFVSTNVGTDGKTYTKFVIRTCAVMSRKADRAADAPADGGDRVLNLDEDAAVPTAEPPVASAQPASAPQQALLAQLPQLPSGPAEALAPLPDAAPPVETAENPF